MRHLFSQMRQREFWTSFDARRQVVHYCGDQSKSTTVRLVGFFRALEVSWSRPWYPPGDPRG